MHGVLLSLPWTDSWTISNLQVVRPSLRVPDSIQDHVPAYFEKMAVFLDQDSLVPALEQMTGPAVPFVEELGIHSVQLSHAEGKITVWGLDKEVIMVGHEAVGVADPIVAL